LIVGTTGTTDEGAVRLDDRPSTLTKAAEVCQRDDTEPFRAVRGNVAVEIVEPPDAVGEAGLGEDPPAPQAAQAVDLREAPRHDERRPEVEGAWWRVVEHGVEVDLVDEHLAPTRSAMAPTCRSVAVSVRAGRVVQVGEHDEARSSVTASANASRSIWNPRSTGREPTIRAPRHSAWTAWLVGRPLEGHLVAGR
jgi:hypothetical protein